MTVTNADVVRTGLEIITKYRPTYNSWIGEGRCYPENPPHVCDCSGLMCAILRKLGIGAGCISSAIFAQIGHQQNLGVNLEFAKTHAGYFLIRGPNEGQSGYGNEGHIGIGLGINRLSLEARGTFAGVGIFNSDQVNWSYAMRIPKVSYSSPNPTTSVIKPTPLSEEQEVIWLPGQSNSEFRPIGVSVRGGTIFLWNVTKNPFKEGTIGNWPNAHVLHIPLAAGEEILAITDRRPDGSMCPPTAPVEVITNLPNQPAGKGQPRHVLNRAA